MMKDLFKNIKLIGLDVDGVFTDGRIYIDNNGIESKAFHTHDGYGIRQLIKVNIKVVVISGRKSEATAIRMSELGINEVHLGCNDKKTLLIRLAKKYSIPMDSTAFIGDDIPDLEALNTVGLPVAVANAQPAIKKVAKYVTKKAGGSGAIREISDLILHP